MTPGRSAAIQLVLDPWLEAARLLQEDVRCHPGFADRRHLLGLLHLAEEDGAAALEEFEAALAANPAYKRAQFNRLVALRMRDGQLDPALWGTLDLTGEEEPERSLWTAWFLAQGGDRNGTRSVLENLARAPEWRGIAHFSRAAWEDSWGENREARSALESAATSDATMRRVLERRGGPNRGGRSPRTVLGVVGGPSSPLAANWNPASSDLYDFLGGICARSGLLEQAEAFYEDAYLRLGRVSLHLVNLASLALARGDEEEAVRTLCRAIEVDPASVAARSALGFEYQSQGYQEEALIQFEVAARLRPDYPDLQYNLGLLYESQGRTAEAEQCLRRALEINSDYFQARTSLAQLLLRQDRHEEALKELRTQAEQGLTAADLHVQMAQAHLAMDQPQEAVEKLEQAVSLNPTYARTYYVLGQAYRQLGLRRKARRAWQQYLRYSREWGEEQVLIEMEGRL